MSKTVFIFIVVIALLAAALLVFNFLQKTDPPNKLSSLGYDVEIKDVTFRGYESQNISFEKDKEKVLMQTVSNVAENKSSEVVAELTAKVVDAQNDITIFDPYQEAFPKSSNPSKKKRLLMAKLLTTT